jgi:hydroxyacylglutathione hydrolase
MVIEVEPFTTISVAQAKAMIEKGDAQVFDIRPAPDYFGAHIAGSISMPLMAIRARTGEVVAGQNLIFFCEDGSRSPAACRLAATLDLKNLYHVEGGINAWIKAGYAVEAV